MLKLTVGELRFIIREVTDDCWGGSRPEEMYEQELADDPSLAKQSVLVPDDIKDSIRKWMKTMGLSDSKKRARSS